MISLLPQPFPGHFPSEIYREPGLLVVVLYDSSPIPPRPSPVSNLQRTRLSRRRMISLLPRPLPAHLPSEPNMYKGPGFRAVILYGSSPTPSSPITHLPSVLYTGPGFLAVVFYDSSPSFPAPLPRVICRGPGSLAAVLYGSSPHPPLSRHAASCLSFSVFYISFNTLWAGVYNTV